MIINKILLPIRRRSVLLTILFALGVTLLSVSYTFFEFYKLNKNQHIDSIFTKYSVITQILREHSQKNSPLAVLEANLALYDLTLIQNPNELKVIINNAEVLKREGFQAIDEGMIFDKLLVYKQKFVQDMRASMLEFYKEIYFYIESNTGAVLLKDSSLNTYLPWNLLYTYLTIVVIILSSFGLILQRIAPLRELQKKIALFGAGDMSVSFEIKGENEIALVSNELETTRNKINSLLESRTLFLRNIMHELKTPITKGRIAAQLLDSEKHKDRFDSIFLRLEDLIGEFALIEELTSAQERLEIKEYRVVDLIDSALDMAMVESDEFIVEIDSRDKIEVDFNFFSTAIKNMIDNGIKYSSNKRVKIYMMQKSICFESYGDKLKNELSFYTEPFTKEHPSKDSFGLGLYLVDTILKIHSYKLEYEYAHGVNRFIFTPLKQLHK